MTESPEQFLQEIRCPKCPQQGHATWEAKTVTGGLRRLASLSDGFRSAPPEPGCDPALICNRCGTAQIAQKSIGA